jgi:hypothetical protein
MGRHIPTHIFNLLYFLLFGLGVTIPAVDRLIAAGLKGDFRLFSTPTAGGRKHLARASVSEAAAAIAALGPSIGPANGATLGLISIALGCKEFLLFSSKGEGFSTIGTGNGFFRISH